MTHFDSPSTRSKSEQIFAFTPYTKIAADSFNTSTEDKRCEADV
jgi:hypothetical protein